MKNFVILILIFWVCALCGCKEHKLNQNKRVWCINPIGEKEYQMFCVCGKDTSANCFDITDYKRGLCVQIFCNSWNNRLYSYIESNYTKTTYKKMLVEFSDCVEYVAHKGNIMSLKYIDFHLSSFGDIAVAATNYFNEADPDGNDYGRSGDNVLRAVQKTTLVDDFNKILSKYGLEVDRVESPECKVFVVERKVFLDITLVEDKKNIPKGIIDIPVELVLKKKVGK